MQKWGGEGRVLQAEGMTQHRLYGGQERDECGEMTEPVRLGAHGVSRRCGGQSVRALGALLRISSWKPSLGDYR